MFDETQLAALGLRGARLGPAEGIAWPISRQARGLDLARWSSAAAEPGVLHGWMDEGRCFHEASAAALAEGGAIIRLLEGRPGVITVEPARGRHVDLRGFGVSPQNCEPDPDDPDRYEIDLTRTGPVVALTGAGGVACALEGNRLIVAPLRFPFDTPAEPRIDPPFERWSSALDDQWLASELRVRAEGGYWWQRLVAVGLLDRLRESNSDIGSEIYEWVMGIERDAWRAIERFAVTEAQAISDLLMYVEAEPNPDSAAWRDQLLVVCHRRDDLEGVRRMLDEAGSGSELEPVLADLDEAGMAARYSLPWFSYPDERLKRVGERDVEAWWVHVFDAEPES